MNNIANIEWAGTRRRDLLNILQRLENQHGMIADLAQILQILEDVLLGAGIFVAILHSRLGK